VAKNLSGARFGGIDAQTRIAELEAEVAKLRATVEQLHEENMALRAENEALRQGEGPKSTPTFVKPNTHKQKRDRPRKTRRQRSAEQSAQAVRRRETPTEIRRHALERCPDCGYPLRGESVARRRQVIDLPVLPAVQVVEHQVIKRWCPVCQAWHSPRLDLSEAVLGQRRIGHRVASLVSWLRTELRLPVASVQAMLAQVFKLHVSAGQISELAHAVAEAGQSTVSAIETAIRARAHVHMDETTWREDGDNGYVWAMSTTDGLRSYTFTFSRAGVVPEGLLRGFTGTLVTDFYGGYNHTPGRHQRCWVHLLRDLHELIKTHAAAHPELPAWIDAVIQTYRDAKALNERAPPPTLAERLTAADALVERVQVLGRRWAQAEHKAHPAHAMCKRLLRHDLELFEFVRQPGLAAHNNLAERSVRPLVIARKISGGTRSERGSHTRMALQTLFATWAAQGKSALAECQAMLARGPGPLPQS
jgi:regulator of replication initiation timing